MRVHTLILIFLLFTTDCVSSQESDDFGARFNRLQATLSLAKSESSLAKSDLEFVDGQRERVKELRQRHNEIVKEFRSLPTEQRNSPEGKAAILKKFANLENELTKDILLPHQTDLLRSKVFFTMSRVPAEMLCMQLCPSILIRLTCLTTRELN